MGKAALLFVLATGLAGATILYTTQQADISSAEHQGEYEADVIAREIARSAYNAASADIHGFGTDIQAAINGFGVSATDCANGKPVCARRTGEMLGGTYLVEASFDGGNGIDLYTEGTFGYSTDRGDVSKSHRINESQTVGVLQVGGGPTGSGGGYLRIQFVDSQAGYCSAIFLQRKLPGVEAANQPLPEMVYAPGKGRNGERNVGTEVFMAAGTQMNFAIGVDTNCSQSVGSRGSKPKNNAFAHLRMDNAARMKDSDGDGRPDEAGLQALADAMAAYVFDEADWNWVHWALDASTLDFSDPREGPWAMVETDPSNSQRWRIAFEDIHNWNLAPDHRDYNNPNKSLWATKAFGYDWSGSFRTVGSDGVGNGWTDNIRVSLDPVDSCDPLSGYNVREHSNASDGFHDLRDTGSPADFSDQVIMVEIIPPAPGGGPDYRLPASCSSSPI